MVIYFLFIFLFTTKNLNKFHFFINLVNVVNITIKHQKLIISCNEFSFYQTYFIILYNSCFEFSFYQG